MKCTRAVCRCEWVLLKRWREGQWWNNVVVLQRIIKKRNLRGGSARPHPYKHQVSGLSSIKGPIGTLHNANSSNPITLKWTDCPNDPKRPPAITLKPHRVIRWQWFLWFHRKCLNKQSRLSIRCIRRPVHTGNDPAWLEIVITLVPLRYGLQQRKIESVADPLASRWFSPRHFVDFITPVSVRFTDNPVNSPVKHVNNNYNNWLIDIALYILYT
jgi:hypothetical protein